MRFVASSTLPALLAFALMSVLAGSARAQQQGIAIAGASPTAPIQLLRGCNQVVTDAPNGARLAGLVTLVSAPDAVISIWRYNNATKLYQAGYFSDQTAPTDFVAMGSGGAGRSTEAYFVCVGRAAIMIGA